MSRSSRARCSRHFFSPRSPESSIGKQTLSRQFRCISRLKRWKIIVISRRAARSWRGGHCVQTLSVHDDLALRRALEHIDTAHERGFAGTAHADDAVDVAVWNGQGDVLERV